MDQINAMPKINIKSMRIQHVLIFAITLLGSFGVLKYRGTSLYIWFQLISVIVFLIVYKKIYIPFRSIRIIYLSLFVTTLLTQFSSIPQSYKNAAIYIYAFEIPAYICIGYLYRIAKSDISIFKIIHSALKYMCVFQLAWCVIEFVTYYVSGVDLNDLIFVQILQTTNDASYMKLSQFMPTGFSHHPAVMAPIVVLSFFLFDNIIAKIVICAIGFCIMNATTVIGVLLCVFYELVKLLRGKYNRINKKTLICVFFAIVVVIGILISTGIYKQIIEQLTELFYRISISEYDSSSNAHKRYFTSYPDVLSISSIQQILFGYGEGCSGYTFGVLFNQYTNLGNWSVECTVIDYLISRGIIGFILSYAFLVKIIIKGKKINIKYSICVIIWILQGITYHTQFDWLVFIEMIFYTAIFFNYDLFNNKLKGLNYGC